MKQEKNQDKVQKPSPFGTIKAISETRPLTYQSLVDAGLPYETFLVNRAFSLTADTVLIAAMLNERSHLDADVQALFYINTIRPRKRWEKWPKGITDKRVTIVAKYYGISEREAKLSMSLHSEDQLSTMEKAISEGTNLRTVNKFA